MNKSGSHIALFVILISALQSYAQVQSAHAPGDTVYRYGTELDRNYESFASINLQTIQFPCVDRFIVIPSSMPGCDYELYKKDYREIYQLDATLAIFKGLQGPDPFMGKSMTLNFLNEGVPMVRSSRKDDFYERSRNAFIFQYKLEHLADQLREWARLNGVNQIRESGSLNTKASYKRPDSFNTLYETIEGFVIDNVWNYQVQMIEVKADQWRSLDRSIEPILDTYFGDLKYHFLSFYGYNSLAEKARITMEPVYRFYYNLDKKTGRYLDCNHSAPTVYVFPNPTFGALKAKFSKAKAGRYTFKISNIIGKLIWQTDMELVRAGQQFNIELPGLSKGVYLYKVVDPAGNVIQSRRLIIVDP